MDNRNFIEARSLIPRVTAYAFFDLKDGPMSDAALCDAGCRILTSQAFWNDEDEYGLILCRIRDKDKKRFEDAMEKLKNRMLLTGHPDYMDYCKKMIKKFYEELGKSDSLSDPSDEP